MSGRVRGRLKTRGLRRGRSGLAARLAATALASAAAALAGCGTTAPRAPDLSRLPLVQGSRISVQKLACDTGANAYCGWELVVVAPRYRDSDELLRAEHRQLLKRGWSGAAGDIGGEKAADSPGHRLRVTYATPTGDLRGYDLGWIRRSPQITLALSRAYFAHEPAMSMLLEQGAA